MRLTRTKAFKMLFLCEEEAEPDFIYLFIKRRKLREQKLLWTSTVSHIFSPGYLHPLQNVFHPRGLILSMFQINDTKATDCNHSGFDVTVKSYEDVTISKKTRIKLFLW